MASAIAIITAATAASLAILTSYLAAAVVPPVLLLLTSGFVSALGIGDVDDNFRKAVSRRPISMSDRFMCAITVCTWWILVCVGLLGAAGGFVALAVISAKTRVVALIAILATASVWRILARPAPDTTAR